MPGGRVGDGGERVGTETNWEGLIQFFTSVQMVEGPSSSSLALLQAPAACASGLPGQAGTCSLVRTTEAEPQTSPVPHIGMDPRS